MLATFVAVFYSGTMRWIRMSGGINLSTPTDKLLTYAYKFSSSFAGTIKLGFKFFLNFIFWLNFRNTPDKKQTRFKETVRTVRSKLLAGQKVESLTKLQNQSEFYIWVSVHHKSITYRVSHELRSLLRESVPYVKIYWYNPKHLCPKLNGYGDNGQRRLKLWQLLHTYWLPNTY